ncbi:MAG: MFS transporter [Bacteroidaceae bacterium]|nr:MFS transporter [Bacteroidaceae bacterium]
MASATNSGGLKFRLTVLNFLEFAIWGSYLTCMSRYLITAGLGDYISYFYSVQGFVSLFMPALMGIVADRWIQAQKTLSLCQFVAGIAMCAVAFYGNSAGSNANFSILFSLYTLSVAFYMPTIALTNSVAYAALEGAGEDTVKAFPPIRVWGTIGFIIAMLCIDWSGLQDKPWQFAVSGVLSIIMAIYALTMPACPTNQGGEKKSLIDALGLRAFALFKQRKMAIFFIFSMLLGSALQITNGYANPFIASFGAEEAFANTFGVQHANTLISLSQISETLCILLIPFFLKRFGIKIVMLMSMFAWVLRFGFFAVGDPGQGVWLFILSMIVYGVAFDFFNISGSLFVDQETDLNIRSSAQGLFMMMTNGFGASIGMLLAGVIVNRYTHGEVVNGEFYTVGDWSTCWYIFAGYALVVAILFAILFQYKHERK